MKTEAVAYWIIEREEVRKKKEAGLPRPWSDDPIFNTYRFCNVRREDDRVTRWVKKYWRDGNGDHPNIVAAMILARMVNWPPTLEEIGFPFKWDADHIIGTIQRRAAKGYKAWTGAYVVTTCGVSMDKAEYVQTVAATALAPRYMPRPDETLESVWTNLCSIDGLGAGFLAAQVVADLKHCNSNLKNAPDWMTWAAPGPGSRRGLNRFFEADLNSKWGHEDWLEHLHIMMQTVAPLLPSELQDISAQDYQNVMCEFDKYQRVVEGQGRPRSRYKPETEYEV